MSVANAVSDIAALQATVDVREECMSPPVTTLMRAAKLVGLTGEYPCVVRDVSEAGVRVRLFHPLPEQRLALELSPGVHYFMEKTREGDGEASLASATPIDMERFLEAARERRHPVWHRVRMPGSLRSRIVNAPVHVSALAQQGAVIETGLHMALEEVVLLGVPGLPAVNARIAERYAAGYRLLFESAFRLDQLAQLIWAMPRWEQDSNLVPIEGGRSYGARLKQSIRAIGA